MYRDSVGALRHLLSSAVSRIDTKSGRMQNGIEYCVVHVQLAGGVEYRIEAYDSGAAELCSSAKEHSAILCLH